MGLTLAERRWAILGLGFLTWIVPLYTYYVTMWIEIINPTLFLIVVILVGIVVALFCYLWYLPSAPIDVRREGVILGFSWLIINLILDIAYRLTYTPVLSNLLGYATERGWHFLYLPAVCIIASIVAEQKYQKMQQPSSEKPPRKVQWKG